MAKTQTELELGNLAYSRRSYAAALEHYQRAIRKFPELSRVLEYNIYISKKRLAQADPSHPLTSSPPGQFSGSTVQDFQPETTFDRAFYLEQNPDIKDLLLDPEAHYYQCGEADGKWPNKFFDPQYYLRVHADVRASGLSPFRHYVRHGYIEKRKTKEPGIGQGAEHGQKSRGTLVLVTHDTDVGGAQHVLSLFAKWLKRATRFDVRIVSIKGGNLRHHFAEIAPLFVFSEHPKDTLRRSLNEWMGSSVVGVFVNSIASASVLSYIPKALPVVAFIHELPNILDHYKDEVQLVRDSALRIIGGGPDVSKALVDVYGFNEEKVHSSVSFIEPLPTDVSIIKRRRAARLALKCPESKFVVIGCGVLHWRKSPDKFIEVAERVIATGLDALFIWLGGGPDQDACNALVAKKGLQDRVRFTGYEPQVAEKIAAGDVFLLSSQEDPFPLVALYAAQAGIPIVCFQEAGGIESFVAKGSGIASPFMDVEAMAEGVLTYAKNPAQREAAGRIGQMQVKRGHTVNVIGPLLLNHLREVAGIPPEISVIVPNYNYEAYLGERLESIANQSFQDFEVIMLDDASSDGSVRLLEEFAYRRPGSQVIVNAKNSGSPFAQWIRGANIARADLIWLAEADDRCTYDFLETMLPFFDDRNVRIASCASQPITAEGEIIGDYRALYLDRINAGRWDEDYIATDHEEANAGLGIANSIPNASAVLFRKFTPEPEFVQDLVSMRLCGDWYFYVRAMRGGLVGFSAKRMNDHRRHAKTVTHQFEGTFRYFDELVKVRNYLGRTYSQSEEARMRIAEFLHDDIVRFNIADPAALPKANVPIKVMPTLLVVAPDLSPGGGQVFAITVANEWARQGGRVVLLNVANQQSHPAILSKIKQEVTCIDAGSSGADLGTLINRFNIDAIHSCIWWADRWVHNHRAALPDDMPWVISMHGCHETILHNPNIDPTFMTCLESMKDRGVWVYTAEKNLEVFEHIGVPSKLVYIPNGISEDSAHKSLRRADVGLREEATVLCLASRAIESKGWFESVRLTERFNSQGQAVDLLLIGEGPAADQIKLRAPDHVHLIGQVSNLQDYLLLADIGLLPSYFIGESFPLVLLEMMAKSLPIVASDVGEIPRIVGTEEDVAGLIVPRKDSGIDEEELHSAVLRLLDPKLRNRFARNARARYEKDFTVQAMVERYKGLYLRS